VVCLVVVCGVQCRKEPGAEDSSKADNDETKDEKRSYAEQTILYPHEVRHHLRQLWANEKHVLRHVFRALAVNAGSMEYPVDIFFKQVQPVMPTRYRPVCTDCSVFTDVNTLSVNGLMNILNVNSMHRQICPSYLFDSLPTVVYISFLVYTGHIKNIH